MELTVSSEPQAQQCTTDATTQMLLAVVQQLAIELHPHKHNALTVTLDSALERDLGFDSLGRMELLLRLERTFGVQLPEQVLATAEVLRDLVEAVHKASIGTALRVPTAVETGVSEAADGYPLGPQPWSRCLIGTHAYTLSACTSLCTWRTSASRRSPMRDCMSEPRRSPQGCKRAVSSQDKPWRLCCPPVKAFSWAFMVFCWLGGFLCLSIRRPACHSLRSTCTVRCAFSVTLRP